ncbi:MAG: ATP-dependent helicase HrpB [Pseudomonadota bacterium]|nr:ATP-dependent helicase HrpB [Pseudomonadota bacterium]
MFENQLELPIEQVLPELLQVSEAHSAMVLQAPPGAGKTTRVPLALLACPWLKGKILLIQPRRLAVYSAAHRLAQQLGEVPGQTVGYRTRYDRCVSGHNRIEVVTDGIFLAQIQRDPELNGIAMVLFDEFHERSANLDLGLAFALEAQQLRDSDQALRLMVMSATLDGERLSRWLDAPLIQSQGRSHPVTTHYRPLPRDRYPEQAIAAVIEEALRTEQGSLLVFLPGMGEIRALQRRLEQSSLPDQVVVLPLHASLPREQQQAALTPAPAGQRKVVLATNVAETSITIEDVRVVIDSGQVRVARYDERRGLNGLHTERVSAASAEQRRGRAGRTQPGVCYRLWGEIQQASLKPFSDPELLTTDLQPIALELAQWGVPNPEDLTLLDHPPADRLLRARASLRQLGALREDDAITEFGRRLGQLGLPPRLAALVLNCQGSPVLVDAIRCAAILNEGDPLLQGQGQHQGQDSVRADILLRLAHLESSRHPRLHALVKQIQQRLPRAPVTRAEPLTQTQTQTQTLTPSLAQALAKAFPDRIAQQRSGHAQRYLMSNGKGVQLHPHDPLTGQRFLVILEAGGSATEARVELACPLTLEDIKQALPALLQTTEALFWEPPRQAVAAQQQLRLGSLVLQQHPLPKPWPPQTQAQTQTLLLEALREAQLAPLPWTQESRQFCARLLWLASRPGEAWPDFSPEALAQSADEWLEPFLEQRSSFAELEHLPLLDALKNRLGWARLAELDGRAPTHWTLATGTHPIDYSNRTPTLRVRLQECYGLQQHPTLPDGTPLTLELLSPARRPIQITRDLVAFWSGSYTEVAKEMRGRYPKHFWPEDPASAPATTRTKRAMGKQEN